MKKTLYYLTGCVLAFCATACSDDYLDQSSVAADVDDSVIFANLDNVKMAINGIALLQSQQYDAQQGYNGEGTIKSHYGSWTGQDCMKNAWSGWSVIWNMEYFNTPTYLYCYFPWHYLYQQIGNANRILDKIDGVPGSEYTRDFYKAQTLVYRAYAYSNLVKIYSRRWSDRQGESRGVVLRTTPSTGAQACASLKTVYAQIYADLDEAISLFKTAKDAGVDRASSERYLPNIDVAYAVYSRAALNREDWATAQKYADLACASYPLMTAANYGEGFNAPNSEWIWEAYNSSSQTLYYYGFFAYNASNSGSSSCRTYPIGINRELINQIPEGDARRNIYAIPTAEELDDLNAHSGNGFNATTYAVSSSMDFYKRVKSEFASKLYSTTTIYPYMSFKFQTVAGSTGDGELCLFRSAEMLYNAAEAAYRQNNENAARTYLEKAVKPYQSDYTCSLSGNELLTEIKKYRRFDLFAEGLDWFDLKRWGESLVRHKWTEGGNFISAFVTNGNYGPTDRNNWCYYIPAKETDYNDKVLPVEPADWKEGDEK